jgi:hypothetical protein
MSLNAKQERFAHEYSVDHRAADVEALDMAAFIASTKITAA